MMKYGTLYGYILVGYAHINQPEYIVVREMIEEIR
jgi:hypothetical protein